MTFMGATLTEKEQRLLTSVVVELACEQKQLTDENVLHRVLEMAECHALCNITQRELRKVIHGKHSENDESYQKGYKDCAKMIQDIIADVN